MNLSQALRISSDERQVIAVSGAGGKTTALFQLARQLRGAVIVTTTTHLGTWQAALADQHVLVHCAEDVAQWTEPLRGVTLITGAAGADARLAGLEANVLAAVRNLAEQQGCHLLIEADGARARAVKAPAAHEPLIPDWARRVLVCAGLGGLGQSLDTEHVHRVEAFAMLSGIAPGEAITADGLARVLRSSQGGLQGTHAGQRRVLLLNQADEPADIDEGLRIATVVQAQDTENLRDAKNDNFREHAYAQVVIASLRHARIERVVEPIYGVILAAGGAERYGQPKMLLDWQGKPLIRHAAETALASHLDGVMVVVGAGAEAARAALRGLPVVIRENPEWAEGQSTSLRAGMAALPKDAGAVLFLLADQPWISAALIDELIAAHRQPGGAIIAPRVGERRANPTLFDQQTFADLQAIRGDMGGRVLMERYPITWVNWQDARLLWDIDTPADYARLKAEAVRLEVNQAVRLEVNQAVRLEVNQAVRQEVNQAVRQEVNQAVRQEVNQAVRLTTEAVPQETNQAVRITTDAAGQDVQNEEKIDNLRVANQVESISESGEERQPEGTQRRIGAVVLAAGESRRMGQPKMMLAWKETTVIGQVVQTLQAAEIATVVVVTGGAQERVRQALAAYAVRCVVNDAYSQSGMLTSLQIGIHEVIQSDPTCNGILIVLGDQPTLSVETIRAICRVFRGGAQAPLLLIPSYQMRRGHPWLVARALWPDLLQMGAEQTMRDFLKAHEQAIHYVTVNTPEILQDLDTPDDYRRYRSQEKDTQLIKIGRLTYTGEPILEPLTMNAPVDTLDAATRLLPGGAYTTFRTFGRDKSLPLADHFRRLEETARLAGQTLVLDTARIRAGLREALADYPAQAVRARLIVDLQEHLGDVYVLIESLHLPPAEAYQKGVKVITRQMHRENPKAKLTSFVAQAGMMRQNLPADVNEAVMVAEDGRVLEGLSSNFFAVRGGEIWTAEEGVLSGITREGVLAAIRGLGLQVHLEGVTHDMLPTLEEAFLTSATRSVLPVTTIDGQAVGTGEVGTVTRQVLQAYEQQTQAALESI